MRWTQTLSVPTASLYSFSTRSDDGIRVSLDGSDVINNWTDHGSTTDLGSRALTVGDHPLVVEYYERGGGAVAQFSYALASCPAGQWLAQYYTGTALAGPVVGARCEASITNDWGLGGPTGVGVGVDNFSVRWSQTLSVPSAALYSFSTQSDDGIRVSLDGSDVINNWTDHGSTTDLGSQALAVGDHPLVVEYYERVGGAAGAVQLRRRIVSRRPVAGPVLHRHRPGRPGGRCPLRGEHHQRLGSGGPTGVGVGVDNFSVRWSQTLSVPTASLVLLQHPSDDGIRVSLDGSDVINNWTDHGPTTNLGSRVLTVGDHPLVVEFYENGGGAVAQFSYAAGS